MDIISIDLNQKQAYGDSGLRFAFGGPVKVCRNTNVVFSPYDDNGMNKVRLAFMGTFSMPSDDGSYKVSSCDAMTRYEFDSHKPEDLALLKGKYFIGDNVRWSDIEGIARRYVDSEVAASFNSYDSNDKYVMMIEFRTPLDSEEMFDADKYNGIRASVYNILCDAGYIPHFAYQSLIKYAEKDPGGVAYTFRNQHLRTKEHMQFELLGLDDKSIPEAFETM